MLDIEIAEDQFMKEKQKRNITRASNVHKCMYAQTRACVKAFPNGSARRFLLVKTGCHLFTQEEEKGPSPLGHIKNIMAFAQSCAGSRHQRSKNRPCHRLLQEEGEGPSGFANLATT